jgi:hypothetical protein
MAARVLVARSMQLRLKFQIEPCGKLLEIEQATLLGRLLSSHSTG